MKGYKDIVLFDNNPIPGEEGYQELLSVPEDLTEKEARELCDGWITVNKLVERCGAKEESEIECWPDTL